MNVHAREFNESARRYTVDLRHRDLIQKALSGYYAKRDEYKNRFQNWSGARDLAAEIKWEAINHLDRYLDEFASKLEAHGTRVFWAPGAQEARDYIVGVARQHKVRSIIKSKSMTAEEIRLNEALGKEGFEVIESDLGEYIVQLRQEPPYHLVFPAMHLTRQQISDLFHDKLGSEPTNNPEDLTMIARRVMRRKYCEADMGISGANFAIAETGMISITENEGNARLTTSLPKIHVALVGIEKVLPKLSDFALFRRCWRRRAQDSPSLAITPFTADRVNPANPTARRNFTSCCWIITARNCWRTPNSATRSTASAAALV